MQGYTKYCHGLVRQARPAQRAYHVTTSDTRAERHWEKPHSNNETEQVSEV